MIFISIALNFFYILNEKYFHLISFIIIKFFNIFKFTNYCKVIVTNKKIN